MRLESPNAKIAALSFKSFPTKCNDMRFVRIGSGIYGLKNLKRRTENTTVYTSCEALARDRHRWTHSAILTKKTQITGSVKIDDVLVALVRLKVISINDELEHLRALKEEKKCLQVENKRKDFYRILIAKDFFKILEEDVDNLAINLTSSSVSARQRGKILQKLREALK